MFIFFLYVFSIHFSIDAASCVDLIRQYVNDREAKEVNAKMRVLDCDGKPKLCLFATRDIEIGDKVS